MTEKAQHTIATTIQLWGLTLLTLHLAAPFLPVETTWSVWPYTFLPSWIGWILALMVGLLIIPPINKAIGYGYGTLLGWGYRGAIPLKVGVRKTQLLFAGVVALLLGIVFYIARLQHLKWGDSYLLTIILSYPDLEERVIYNWQAPLTVLLHQRLWQFIANPLWGWDVGQVYAWVSIIIGVGFVFILLMFMHHLARNRLDYAILTGLMLTTGSMQLFFGYVENYVIISLCLLITMWLSWLALHHQLPLFWPIVGLSITNAFHPSTVFIWPGMLLLSWLCYRRGYVKLADGLVQTIVPPLLIGGLIFAIMEMGGHGFTALTGVDKPGGGDGIWFVPLFETVNEWQRYTMFSPAHIIDWVNIHLLISPMGLPIIIMITLHSLLCSTRIQHLLHLPDTEADFVAYLGVTSFCYLLFTFVWNADYGGQHDWDLFAPSAWSYTLLAGFLLVRALSNQTLLRQTGIFTVAVSLLHLVAWVWTNMHALPHS